MKFIKTVGLFIVIFFIAQSFNALVAYDWVFVYYMPYDNNLDRHGETILNELKKGTQNASNIAVVIQADFEDSKGMQRISFCNGTRKLEERLESENSADEEEYGNYLDWVKENWEAENYVLVFLGHGGGLDSICSDDRPYGEDDFGSSKEWMNAKRAGEFCKKFNEDTGSKVKLLFLQQCGRGSLENVYNFIDSAEYIMGSPVNVGAPNTYYATMLPKVAQNPNNLSGKCIANIIMETDRHYEMYTLIANDKLKELPDKLELLFDALDTSPVNRNVVNIPGSLKPIFSPPTETSTSEKNYDLKKFLDRIKVHCDSEEEIEEFSEWYTGELIVEKRYKNHGTQLSGLSLFIPSNQQQLRKYSLQLFEDTCIKEIFALLLNE